MKEIKTSILREVHLFWKQSQPKKPLSCFVIGVFNLLCRWSNSQVNARTLGFGFCLGPDSWGVSHPPDTSRNVWLVPPFAHCRRHWGFCVPKSSAKRHMATAAPFGSWHTHGCAAPELLWQDIPQENTGVTLYAPEVPCRCAAWRRTASCSLHPFSAQQNTPCRLDFLARVVPMCAHWSCCELAAQNGPVGVIVFTFVSNCQKCQGINAIQINPGQPVFPFPSKVPYEQCLCAFHRPVEGVWGQWFPPNFCFPCVFINTGGFSIVFCQFLWTLVWRNDRGENVSSLCRE